MHGDSRMAIPIPDHWFTQRSTHYPPVISIKQILDNFEQTMDIKEKFMQHCHIGINLKRQDCTEHMHCEIPLNTQISKFNIKIL